MEKLLTEICNPKQWKTISTSKLLDEGYTVYGANGIIGYYSEYTHEKPTLMITCRGATCGTLNISKPFSYINGNAMSLDNLDEDIDIKYLYYYLKNRGLKDTISGSAQPQITRIGLANVKINYPNIETQKKIVGVLDKTQELIDKRKEQIEVLDELVKSRFIEMFGDPVINTKNWNIKKLGELGYFKNGMNYKQSDSGFNIKFLGVGEFKYGNRINNSSILPMLELQEKPNDEYLLKDGDIVFVRSNGSKELVGRSVLIEEIEQDATYSGFCIRYRNESNEVEPRFLINLFSDEGFKNYFKKDIRGANINNLNQQMLSNLNIILPPIELQNQFADFVNQVDKLKSQMEVSLKELEDNFNSLMQKAFKGELF